MAERLSPSAARPYSRNGAGGTRDFLRIPTGDAQDDFDDRDRTSRSPRERGDEDDDSDTDESKHNRTAEVLHDPRFRIAAFVVVLLLIAGGVIWWLHARHYESTDDAFIDTHLVQVAPRVAGQITKVYVTDNQDVAAGAPLVELDPADAQARLAEVQAQEAQAEAQYQQAVASVGGAAAQAATAQRDFARFDALSHGPAAAVSRQQLDQAGSTARNTAAQRDAAQAQVAAMLAQIKVLQAQVATAQLALSYTHVTAPLAGHIAQTTAAIGNYVTPGQQVMAIVPQQVWVTANFKETQLTYMRIGQKATVRIDACQGGLLDAHVDSIQRGAGQAFGILPPENATGNYVKVVQRVPVKIVFETIPADCPLGPGMSVEPRVTVR